MNVSKIMHNTHASSLKLTFICHVLHHPPHCRPTATNAESYNTEVCRRLYEVSQELTKAPALPPVKPKAIEQPVAA